MNVLTLPAHLAELCVRGVVTVAVVDVLPTKACPACAISNAIALCLRPDCIDGRVPLDLTGKRIALRAAPWPTDIREAIKVDDAVRKVTPCRDCGHHADQHVCTFVATRCLHCDCNAWRMPDLHPGCIVGSAVVEAVVPIVDRRGWKYDHRDCITVNTVTGSVTFWAASGIRTGLNDQRNLGIEFTPGHHALILRDPAPCEQRCPACGCADNGRGCIKWCDACWRMVPGKRVNQFGSLPPHPDHERGPFAFAADTVWSVWPL